MELPPNGFQDRLVMTTSIPLQKNGAANRSRTDDLILTKDVLYQLSHSSISFFYFHQVFEFLSLVPDDYIIISQGTRFVNSFFKKNRIFLIFFYYLRKATLLCGFSEVSKGICPRILWKLQKLFLKDHKNDLGTSGDHYINSAMYLPCNLCLLCYFALAVGAVLSLIVHSPDFASWVR